MSTSAVSSSTDNTSEDNSYPSSLSGTESTHSESTSASSSAGDHSPSATSSDNSESTVSSSRSSRSASSTASSVTSSRSSPSRVVEDDDDEVAAPLKLPRLEEVVKTLHPGSKPSRGNEPGVASGGGKSIFPAPLLPAPANLSPPVGPPPRYGPTFLPPPPMDSWALPPPPLPTLSAAAKDITEMDVRAGVRLGVYRAATRLNKEQVMDEIESVRMTSSVERVLLELSSLSSSAPQQGRGPPGVPIEEREYAWATVFFASAEAAELCVALLCQPGRRSKWSRMCIQRLPLTSLLTAPLSPAENERYRVHAYQLESAAVTPGTAAATAAALTDTVLAKAANGWCVLSTGGLFPTLGLATYLKHRRSGDFSSVEVCAGFHVDSEKDTCSEGGKCAALHLREEEQWKLLLPVVLVSPTTKASVGISPHVKPIAASTTVEKCVAETQWQKARHADCLVVKPLPFDIDENGFVYMFRRCKGFVRAQTVRTVDQVRYGVVQFTDATSAQEAHQQATAGSQLVVRFYGELVGSLKQPPSVAGGALSDSSAVAIPQIATETTPVADHTPSKADASGTREASATPENSNVNDIDVEEGGGGATHAPGVPFPPLPEGWEFGLSRRTMQYFFLQSGKKSTTWRHPVTQEQYKAKR